MNLHFSETVFTLSFTLSLARILSRLYREPMIAFPTYLANRYPKTVSPILRSVTLRVLASSRAIFTA